MVIFDVFNPTRYFVIHMTQKTDFFWERDVTSIYLTFFRVHSAVHETPENILKQTVLKTKYEFSKDDIKAIDAKMNLVKKKFPLNCHVRIVSRTDEFSKKSVSNLWSETRYSVDGYKRPSDQNEPCAIYLRRLKSNTRVPGIFYPKELKVVL